MTVVSLSGKLKGFLKGLGCLALAVMLAGCWGYRDWDRGDWIASYLEEELEDSGIKLTAEQKTGLQKFGLAFSQARSKRSEGLSETLRLLKEAEISDLDIGPARERSKALVDEEGAALKASVDKFGEFYSSLDDKGKKAVLKILNEGLEECYLDSHH